MGSSSGLDASCAINELNEIKEELHLSQELTKKAENKIRFYKECNLNIEKCLQVQYSNYNSLKQTRKHLREEHDYLKYNLKSDSTSVFQKLLHVQHQCAALCLKIVDYKDIKSKNEQFIQSLKIPLKKVYSDQNFLKQKEESLNAIMNKDSNQQVKRRCYVSPVTKSNCNSFKNGVYFFNEKDLVAKNRYFILNPSDEPLIDETEQNNEGKERVEWNKGVKRNKKAKDQNPKNLHSDSNKVRFSSNYPSNYNFDQARLPSTEDNKTLPSNYPSNFYKKSNNHVKNLHSKPFPSDYHKIPVNNPKPDQPLKMRKLNILSCNVRSITNKYKSTIELLHNKNIDIAVFSELNTKLLKKIPGYTPFNKFSSKKFHGISILINNELKPNVLRIGEEDLEMVHLRIDSCVPPLNILGTYLDVEANQSTDQLDLIWSKLENKINMIIESCESVVLIGDLNRPIQGKPSYGTKLLNNFLNEDTMTLLNDHNTPTRIDPYTKNGSILDLCLVSNNIKTCVKNFKVDSDQKWTPFSEAKRNGNLEKKYSDHYSIMVEMCLPTKSLKSGKRKPVINFSNKNGWLKYPEVSNKYASKMVEAIENETDINMVEHRLNFIEKEILVDCFGITWQGSGKKSKKKSKKELEELYEKEQNDLEDLLSEGLRGKGLDNKMYKLRSLIRGPKHAKQDPQAINHPETGELITNREEIKKVSLEHNKKILTKNEILEEDKAEIEKQKTDHQKIMNSEDKDLWSLDYKTFQNVVKKIKVKGKNMYKNLVESGNKYQFAIFLYMRRLIRTEELPRNFARTLLSQIWKKKGSPLDLNNMRFIHMKHRHPRLLENLVTEHMKDNIVKATPHFQLGGMPGASSVEHLVVLKTWMKMLEQTSGKGIFQVWDMSKFFDKESLLDCLTTLRTKAKIDNKSYRLWFMLNENAQISVNTSVGESESTRIPNTIGQGSVGAALVSSLNIGSALDEVFKDIVTTHIGTLGLNSLIFQDDISKLNDNLDQAREACQKIDRILKRKQLSVNYDKSKFLIMGNSKFKKEVLKKIEKDPMVMGGKEILHSSVEKYLGDLIHEDGCEKSIKETVKRRIQGLISKADEIIQIAESPVMSGLGNATIAFRLYEAQIIPSLLHNAESWIGITDKIINDLQDFQDKFTRKVLRLPPSTTKAIYQWDSGLMSMKWRIAQKKLMFVNKIMQKDHSNIARKTLLQEGLNNIEGLGHECREIAHSIGLPNLVCVTRSKKEIKAAVKQQDRLEVRQRVESSKKVQSRLSDNPEDHSYLNKMPLHTARVWIRVRAYAIKGVKMNQKRSFKDDLNCRFCNTKVPETQEHLESCAGMEYERWGLDLALREGQLKFWMRVTVKLSKLAVATQPPRQGALN